MITNRPLRVVSFRSSVRPLRWGLFPLLALAAVAQAGMSPVPTYTLTDLGTLPGNHESQANALNDRGEVVGSSGSRAFLYSGGKMIDLGAPSSSIPPSPSPASYGNGINDSGQVIGITHVMSGEGGFLYTGGTLHPLDISSPTAINDSGQIVGSSLFGPNFQIRHAVLISGGSTQELGTLGGDASRANAVNDAGQVVGGSSLASGSLRPFLYANGRMIDLGTPGGDGEATAINDRGQIVGNFNSDPQDPYNGPQHAFLYSDGTMHDLGSVQARGINDSGVIIGTTSTTTGAFVDVNGTWYDLNRLILNGSGYLVGNPTAINASGQIAANASTPDGEQHAVLLTPTALPLPAAAFAVLPVVPLVWRGMRPRRAYRRAL